MNERIGVDHLDRRRNLQRAPPGHSKKSRARQDQKGPQPFARRQGRVPHRVIDPRLETRRHQQQTLQYGIGELAAASKALGKPEVGSDHGGSVKFGGLHADGALGTNNDSIDPLLRLVELSFAMPLQLRSALVRQDCFVELDLSAFEPAHDLLKLGKRILETHRCDIGRDAESTIKLSS